MCYTSASAAQSTAKQALANGTLILLVPPMVFFALITVVLYLYRNKYRETSLVTGPSPLAEGRWTDDPIQHTGNSRNEGMEFAAELEYLEEETVVLAKDKGTKDERP